MILKHIYNISCETGSESVTAYTEVETRRSFIYKFIHSVLDALLCIFKAQVEHSCLLNRSSEK